MNVYETKKILPYLNIYKKLPIDVKLTKDMLDCFLTPSVIKYYELNLKARRQNKRYFILSDGDLKMIITQTYLNILKQIDRGVKPIIANKIKELFGQITYNTMMSEMKDRTKYKTEYIDELSIEFSDDSYESVEEKKEFQERNHQLYLQVMQIAQETLTKLELDCFTFKYYSNYTHKEIRELLNISNINKVSIIINQAETKLKEATKSLNL
jgi:DNA-directed RNA polymerase specialized sigma24 family protein